MLLVLPSYYPLVPSSAKGGVPKGIELEFEQIDLEARDVPATTLSAASKLFLQMIYTTCFIVLF